MTESKMLFKIKPAAKLSTFLLNVDFFFYLQEKVMIYFCNSCGSDMFLFFLHFFSQETTCRFSSQIRSIYRKYQSCDSSLTFGSCTRRSGTKMHLLQPNSVVKEWKQLLSQLERRRRRKRGKKNSAYLKSGSPAGKLYIFHFVLHNGSSLSLYHCAVI